MRESDWQSYLIRELRNCNAVVFNIQPNKYTSRGAPDIYVAHRKWCGWLELKGKKTRVEPHQIHTIIKLNERKSYTYILRYPGLILDEYGHQLGAFSTAVQLLDELRSINDKRRIN